MAKLLILGDYEHSHYHPYAGVDEKLHAILRGNDLTDCVEYGALTLSFLQGFDAVIDYSDGWPEQGTPASAGALIAYVALGGKLLGIHNGIISRNCPEKCQLYAGTFNHHPKRANITFSPSGAHPLAPSESFTLYEEPYMFDFDTLVTPEIFMTYRYDGADYPAGWVRPFGLGSVIYLCPGHDASVFDSPELARLINASLAAGK